MEDLKTEKLPPLNVVESEKFYLNSTEWRLQKREYYIRTLTWIVKQKDILALREKGQIFQENLPKCKWFPAQFLGLYLCICRNYHLKGKIWFLGTKTNGSYRVFLKEGHKVNAYCTAKLCLFGSSMGFILTKNCGHFII